MKKKIKLNFSDFWSGFDKEDNYFVDLLKPHYDLEITDDPDYLIYSTFGKAYRKYDCIRIFYTGECIQPNFLECDYSLDFELTEGPRRYRLPHYALYENPRDLIRPSCFDPVSALRKKSRFCAFVVSNPRGKERLEFFKKLSQYKPVDSGGRYLNNVGGPVEDKLTFIQDYKFVIAFENQSYPGYTTEKIYEPMLVNSLPIYWGNPLVAEDFNPKAFIHCHDYRDFDAVVERVVEVDQDDSLYCQYMAEPCYNGNVANRFVASGNLLRFFDGVFASTITPVASSRRLSVAWGSPESLSQTMVVETTEGLM